MTMFCQVASKSDDRFAEVDWVRDKLQVNYASFKTLVLQFAEATRNQSMQLASADVLQDMMSDPDKFDDFCMQKWREHDADGSGTIDSDEIWSMVCAMMSEWGIEEYPTPEEYSEFFEELEDVEYGAELSFSQFKKLADAIAAWAGDKLEEQSGLK